MPLVAYPIASRNEDGIGIPDFTRFEGRLAEKLEYDEASTTWTMHLRHGVKGCSGNEFTAEDVAYTLERAKSVSGHDGTTGLVRCVRGRDQGLHSRTCSSRERTSRSGMR